LAKQQFEVELLPMAQRELDSLDAFYRRKVSGAISAQLTYEPNVVTRNRKPLPGAVAGFEFDPPLWELRVDQYRVFYDVNLSDNQVNVRAIRQKAPGQTTAEIL
jgi:mRNA-degrading endonuclease RelE of RelBE toxin-antitoxin system